MLSRTIEVTESKKGVTFHILVSPNASRAEIVSVQDGALKVKVTAPPVEGAANEACIKLMARALGLRKSQMEIFSGAKSRSKTVLVRSLDKAQLEEKMNDFLKKNRL